MRDVIVIGAGGGGPVVAKELAARGLDVLLLEAGPRFADLERDWTHFENESTNPFTGILRFGPADRRKPAWVRELPQNSLVAQLSGVGGSTNHYLGNSPRAMPGAFVDYDGPDRSAYDAAHVFPLRYRELIPYYEWVEHTLPVETAPMGTKEEVFYRGAAAIGLPVQTTKDVTRASFRPQENAILQPRGNAGRTTDPDRLRFPRAFGCTFCGFCAQGCYEPLGAPLNLRAKRSTSVSYVPMALTADLWARDGTAVTLVADAFATRIHTDVSGVARAVTWIDGVAREEHTEEARVIVAAAGAIETPRLWLSSGLPNPNDWVGRGLTDHFVDVVVGVMPFYTGTSKGPQSAARADYPGYGMLENIGKPPALQAGLMALSDAGIAGYYDNGLPGGAHGADLVGRLVGKELKFLLSNLDRLLNIDVFPDDDVEPQNRVTLSTSFPADEHGPVPRVEVHHRKRSARTIRNREYLVEQAVRLLRAAGATKVYRIHYPPFMFHVHSTMRMGRRSDDSVVDADGEARWVPRLFVADNSALANGLGGLNPTLTMQAVATRTAEKIFERYFGGQAWVDRESPVSSIDSVITRATEKRGL